MIKKIEIISLFFAGLLFFSCATNIKQDSSTKTDLKVENLFEEVKGPSAFDLSDAKPFLCKIENGSNSLKNLTPGKTYEFQIKHKAPWCIINIKNEFGQNWHALKNDGSNSFSKTITIPLDAKTIQIAYSSSSNMYETASFIFNLVPDSKYKNRYIRNYKKISRVDIGTQTYINNEEKLKAGRFYEFNIIAHPEKYCILNFMKGNENIWNVMEKNELGTYYTITQVPAGAKELAIAFSNESSHYVSSFLTFEIESSKAVPSAQKIDDYYEIILNQSFVGSYPQKLNGGQFYNFIMEPNQGYNYSMNFFDKKDNQFLYEDIPMSTTNYTAEKIYIPNKTKRIRFWIDKGNNNWIKFMDCEVKPSKKPYEFVPGNNFNSLTKYRTEKPDEQLIAFMESINAKEMGKTDPDGMINKCIEKIELISESDDYMKVKLIHDMCWYLLSYDVDSYMNDRILPQDYISVLKSNLSVCAGFANLFAEVCKNSGIDCLIVNGYAKGGLGAKAWKKTDNPEEANHAWNIVKLNHRWYFIDVTWDSGKTKNGKQNDFYSTAWLFSNPEIAIYTHYPSESQLQLKTPVVSAEKFMKLPFTEPK